MAVSRPRQQCGVSCGSFGPVSAWRTQTPRAYPFRHVGNFELRVTETIPPNGRLVSGGVVGSGDSCQHGLPTRAGVPRGCRNDLGAPW